ncbi:MAG: hypothetical protein LBS08_00720 [Candidatus Symbiothrix sp.]|nr:hypothetical protein [Candidatus Symbiothrix sp.]
MVYAVLLPLSVSATCFESGSAAPQLHARQSRELRAAERKRKACRGHKIKKPGTVNVGLLMADL